MSPSRSCLRTTVQGRSVLATARRRWAQSEEIGWVHSQEIRWVQFQEIGWAQSEEILHFGTQRWNLVANGASHDGHLIFPSARPHDTKSQGATSTASRKASAVQINSRAENSHGNIRRNTSTARATASNAGKELANSR